MWIYVCECMFTTLEGEYYYPLFTDEETDVDRRHRLNLNSDLPYSVIILYTMYHLIALLLEREGGLNAS